MRFVRRQDPRRKVGGLSPSIDPEDVVGEDPRPSRPLAPLASPESLAQIEAGRSNIDDLIEPDPLDILQESGGSSEETEVIGDEEGEELIEISEAFVYDVRRECINENGFIQQLLFNLVADPGTDVLNYAKARAHKNVFIKIDRFSAPAQQVIIKDYYPVSNTQPPKQIEGRVVYGQGEIVGLNEILGGTSKNYLQVSEDIRNLFGEPFTQDSMFEPSVITNTVQNNKKLIFTSVTENLITSDRRVALERIEQQELEIQEAISAFSTSESLAATDTQSESYSSDRGFSTERQSENANSQTRRSFQFITKTDSNY